MARPPITDTIGDYKQAQTIRQPHEQDWRLAAAYCLPAHYGQWLTDGPSFISGNNQAQALRRTIFDGTGKRSLPKYMAVLERLATPSNNRYQVLAADNTALMKNYRVRSYFDDVTELLFKRRNGSRAGFRVASNETYASMGAYGTGPMYVGKRIPNALSRSPSMIYKSTSLRDIFFLVNAQGEVYKVFRRYYVNVAMFRQEHPGAKLPRTLALEAEKPIPDNTKYIECFHVVEPQNEYDPSSLDERRFSFVSRYVSVTDSEWIGDYDGGYKSMPYLTPRTFTIANDPYGHGPAVQAIESMGGASAVKKAYLKQGNLAATPAILAADDGIMNGTVDITPGAINYGGIDRQGRKLIGTIDPGRWDINAEILKEEQADVEDSFFVTLFQILVETPEMTATEVLERVSEKAALLSPTMGRLQTEFLGPLTERELDVFDELGWMPEMPPELVEARGQYKIDYTSPMAKGSYADEISGFMRAVDFSIQLTEATQDPSHLDHYDFDTAIPEMADKTAVPTRWMASPDDVAAKRDARQAQQTTQELTQAAPGIAALAKVTSDNGKLAA